MSTTIRVPRWEQRSAPHMRRWLSSATALGVVLLGPILAGTTLLVLGPLDQGGTSSMPRIVLLADLVYLLVLAALVLARVTQLIMAHRSRSAGSRLHLRLSVIFAVVALAPTVLVAVFASVTLSLGLESWFSERVRSVLGSSVAAAQAYEEEHRRELVNDAESLADYLNLIRQANASVTDGQLRQLLNLKKIQLLDFSRLNPVERERVGQGEAVIIQGSLKEAFVIDGNTDIRARGDSSYLFGYERPSAEEMERAQSGNVVVIQDWDVNEFRVILALSGYFNRFLYVSRSVDGQILNLLDETRDTYAIYSQLESDRGRILFEFGLLYLGFAVVLILAALWFGLRFAERLSHPIGQLANAAQRVGDGHFDVQVSDMPGDDEIATLGKEFNDMVRRLEVQHGAILESRNQIDRRRRLFDSVLGSVTAGVVGLEREGEIAFVNRSAGRLLNLPADTHEGQIADIVPEFEALFNRLRNSGAGMVQGQVELTRQGKQEILLVRMATRISEVGALEGYVIAFDDVTDLVSAQKMAAWGDVARRIAHEIKNPLTPIRLSAERLKRKYTPLLASEEAGPLAQLTDVIVRKTGDLGRIVDEFSEFARVPEPERRSVNLVELVADAVLLQQEARQEGISVISDLPEGDLQAEVDPTMIGQVLSNLLNNAGEAIEAHRREVGDGEFPGEVRVAMTYSENTVLITVSDNGTGLPPDRVKLLEPYVTTRENGTGLGLPIVRKIVEEHGGTFELTDADPFEPAAHRGARAEIRLPLAGRQVRGDTVAKAE